MLGCLPQDKSKKEGSSNTLYLLMYYAIILSTNEWSIYWFAYFNVILFIKWEKFHFRPTGCIKWSMPRGPENRCPGYRYDTNSPAANKIQNQSGSGLIYVKFVDYGKAEKQHPRIVVTKQVWNLLELRITEHIRVKRKQDFLHKLLP